MDSKERKREREKEEKESTAIEWEHDCLTNNSRSESHDKGAEKLNSGVSQCTIAGTSTQFNPAAVEE